MKIIIVLLLMLSTMVASAADIADVAENATQAPVAATKHTMMAGLQRGCLNLFTCIVELPRNMVYYGVEYPLIGLPSGTVQGAVFSGSRALGGLVDIFTLGLLEDDQTIYELIGMKPNPLDEEWLPPARNPEDYEPTTLPILY